MEDRPLESRGRPSRDKPRTVNARHSSLQATLRPQPERIVRPEEEAGCFVLRTNVPTAGDLAQSARALLPVYQDQHGTEQNDGCLTDPVLVKRLILKQPERLEA